MERNIVIDIIKVVAVLVLGGGVLFWSIVKVSGEGMRKNESEGRLRTVPISFSIKKSDGGYIKGEYKIPASGMLANNPLYGLKTLRNWLWIRMEGDRVEKIQVKLLVADKNLSEAITLVNKSNERLGWEAMKKAVAMLGEVGTDFEEISLDDSRRVQLKFQLGEANRAYRETVKLFENSIEIDKSAWGEIINSLESWNDEI